MGTLVTNFAGLFALAFLSARCRHDIHGKQRVYAMAGYVRPPSVV